MNAGGAFGAIGDSVHSVGCLTTRGDLVIYPANELRMGYRETNIPDGVILWAAFTMEEADPQALKEQLLEVFQYKKATQPSMAESSAGCAFKNPIDPESGDRISAGKLIDQAGLKEQRVGSAQVSRLHGNFLVVDPGGTASDVIHLIQDVRSGVKKAHGIELENEVVIWSRS